ncbi:MAG: hypothetical protein JSS02_14530, partial [Planctomycetes bacterium]|nr:hypothetical protein [Planctomycetota bacterium]
SRRGIRSYTINSLGQLTRQRNPEVKVTRPLPASHTDQLQGDYRHQPVDDVAHRLGSLLTEKQLKRYRTARRRIRSYFGSAAAINQVSVTVGARPTSLGLLCGFVIQVAGNNDRQKGLHASEGYCFPAGGEADPAVPLIHVLRDLHMLQLEQVRADLFVIPPAALELCQLLMAAPPPVPLDPLVGALERLLRATPRLSVNPCVKGRFYDSMQKKLLQLERNPADEVTRVDFAKIARCMADNSVTTPAVDDSEF